MAGWRLWCRRYNTSQDSGWVANNNGEWWNILRHDTAGSYSHALTDGHPRKYDTVASEPAILSNRDRRAGFGPLGAIPDYGIGWV